MDVETNIPEEYTYTPNNQDNLASPLIPVTTDNPKTWRSKSESVLDKMTYSTLTELDLNRPRNSSITQRWFSKMGFGSLRSSVFNMSATAIGAGILSLPYVMRLSGFALGSMLTIGGALACVWSLHILLSASRIVKVKSYVILCKRIGGKPLQILLEASMVSYVIGIIIVYQIVATQLVNSFLTEVGVDSSRLNSWWSKASQITLTTICILYPLSIMRDMSSLSYASLLSIITIGYTMCVVIIESPWYYKQNYHKEGIVWFKFDLDIFDAFSFTFFAFCCQATFFNIYEELQRANVRRVHKVVRISTTLNFLMYYAMAAAGYLSSFSNTKKVICDRPPLDGKEIDYFMAVGKIGVYLTVLISVPVNYAALRRTLFNIFWSPESKISNPRNLIVTAIVLVITSFIAFIFPDIRSVISIIGGFSTVSIAYVVPTICYIISSSHPKYHWSKVTSILLCSILVIFGIGSVTYTIYNIANGSNNEDNNS